MSFELHKSIEHLRATTALEIKTIRENFATLSKEPQVLAEAVTNVLANIATAADEGEPLKLMHLNSIASFLAGVDTLSTALPNMKDEKKKQTALRVLAAVGIDADGYVTYATTPVAQLGARNADLLAKYTKLVQDYAQSQSRGSPDGKALATTTRGLQQQIDRSMRTAAGSQVSPQDKGETTFDPSVAAAQPAMM